VWTKRPSSRSRSRRSPANGDESDPPAAGTISGIGLQVRPRSPRVNVHIDGRFAFSLPADAALHLSVGDAIDDDELRALLARDAAERAYQRALRFLAVRPRSVLEVRRRLRAAGVERLPSAEAIDRLRDQGLLDDTQFATYWVEQRQTFRPRGSRALISELRARGVDRETTAVAVEAVAEDQCDAACRAGLREARRLAASDEREFSCVLGGYLARRGFDFTTTRAAVQRLRGLAQEATPAGEA
jgi:regulatory protein